MLGPFGIGNKKPVVECVGFVVKEVRTFGTAGTHTEISLEDNTGSVVRAVAFFTKPESFSVTPIVGARVQVIGTAEESRFGGRVRTEVRIVDIVN